MPLRVQRPEWGEVCECVCGQGLVDELEMTTFSSECNSAWFELTGS